MNQIPLALYIHIPWCVQKCPYCDFNSHGVKQNIPEAEYISHLLDDLLIDAKRVIGRKVNSIFIGGGTPSLFSAKGIARLVQGVKEIVELADDAEITLEANPGTVESERFKEFQHAGINRISIGVQSFQANKLQSLGRIHDAKQAINAAGYAHNANLNSFNLDLMHGLPDQSVSEALEDLRQAIEQQPPHLSWYQLTIEPNTQFHSKPPELPDDDVLWDIQQQGQQLIQQAGYVQYEISGYSQPEHQCQHNLNYWRFGDYLGIGCGAHGKITDAVGNIYRTEKVKHPRGYMDISKDYLFKDQQIAEDELPFEFFMNRFRLNEICQKSEYQKLTGFCLPSSIELKLNQATEKGLIFQTDLYWQVTPLGRRYLNTLLEELV